MRPDMVSGQDAQQVVRVTAPRAGHAGASLLRRRVWFAPDGTNGQDAQTPESTDNADETPNRDWTGVPDWVRQTIESQERHIQELKHEAQTRRLAHEEAQKQLNALTQGQKKRLEEDGKFKELADQYAAEIAVIKPYQERAEALDKMIRESNAKRIEQIPESMRSLVLTDLAPEKLAAWLDTNWATLTAKRAPDLDAGVGGGSGRKTLPQLNETERRIARMSGMTDEQYAEYKAKGQPSTEEL